jgi:hypothetical protein
MYIRSLTIQGLADLPRLSLENLERRVCIKGPSLAATAVGDGVALAFSALSERALRQLLSRWGLTGPAEEPDIAVEGTPIQATWSDRQLAQGIVADHTKRKIQVRVEILLDPLLCAELREHSAREPRLALALGEEHSLDLEVSAFFGASWDVLSISIQSVVISGERYPTSGAERAPWMSRLLHTLGERFVSHDESLNHAELALHCLTSPRSDLHEQYTRWVEMMSADFGLVRVAHGAHGTAIFMANNRPLARHGADAIYQARWAVSAAMSGADIMWMGSHNARADQLVDGDASPLEQLWTIQADGEIDPHPEGGPRSILPMGTA